MKEHTTESDFQSINMCPPNTFRQYDMLNFFQHFLTYEMKATPKGWLHGSDPLRTGNRPQDRVAGHTRVSPDSYKTLLIWDTRVCPATSIRGVFPFLN